MRTPTHTFGSRLHSRSSSDSAAAPNAKVSAHQKSRLKVAEGCWPTTTRVILCRGVRVQHMQRCRRLVGCGHCVQVQRTHRNRVYVVFIHSVLTASSASKNANTTHAHIQPQQERHTQQHGMRMDPLREYNRPSFAVGTEHTHTQRTASQVRQNLPNLANMMCKICIHSASHTSYICKCAAYTIVSEHILISASLPGGRYASFDTLYAD